MELISKVREEYKKYIDGHRNEMMKAGEAMLDDIKHSALDFRGEINGKLLAIPRLYSENMKKEFEKTVEITYGILDKVIREYLEHEDYRRLFPFSEEMEKMILTTDMSSAMLPLARFDIFYNKDNGDFKFCEINADGSSGMNADRLMNDMLIHNPAHQELLQHYDMQPMELFDTWACEFLSMYEEYAKLKGLNPKRPNVAIIDFLDMGRVREFEEFARHFQRRGMRCEICDIRDLKYEGGVLISDKGHVIDAVYRRAVTLEIMEKKDELAGFLQAVEDSAVFLAGGFCTHIIDNKWTFYVLRHERTLSFLTDEEVEFVKKHIPGTYPFKEGGIEKSEVIKNKDKYILKPWDGYAARGVLAGIECSSREWESFIDKVYGTDYICQEFAAQYDSDNFDFLFDDGRWKTYSHMTGLFVYNGKFAGVIARCAPTGGIIDYYRDERRQPTLIVREP